MWRKSGFTEQSTTLLIYQSVMKCEIHWEKRKSYSYEMFESFEALAGYGNIGFREEIVLQLF